jgi:hypothetical protein
MTDNKAVSGKSTRRHAPLPTTHPAKNSFRHLEDRLEMYFASVKRIALLVADFVIYLYGLYSLTIRLLK